MKCFVAWLCAQLRLWKERMNIGGQQPISATLNPGRKEPRWQSPRKHHGLMVDLEISLCLLKRRPFVWILLLFALFLEDCKVEEKHA